MLRGLIPWERPSMRLWDDDVNDMFRRFLSPEVVETNFVPKTDVAETEKEFEITAELPGLKPEEFSVEVKDSTVLIRGKKEEEKEEKGKTFHRIERRAGQFWRQIPLPVAVDREHVKAEFHDGVLKVIVPKAKETENKPVKVNVR